MQPFRPRRVFENRLSVPVMNSLSVGKFVLNVEAPTSVGCDDLVLIQRGFETDYR